MIAVSIVLKMDQDEKGDGAMSLSHLCYCTRLEISRCYMSEPVTIREIHLDV